MTECLWLKGERQTDYHGRRWEYSEKGKYYLQRPDHHQGFTFTVMSYNVLAQELLEQHREMYYGSWDVLGWKSRKRKLLQEIKVHMPDVSSVKNSQKIFGRVFPTILHVLFNPNPNTLYL